jgi:K+-transporting ATPase KdpF subunit
MKPISPFLEDLTILCTGLYRRKPSRYLLWALCLNLLLAPAVYAATGEALSRSQSYMLGLLGLGTAALSIYLFVVMFQPEKF